MTAGAQTGNLARHFLLNIVLRFWAPFFKQYFGYENEVLVKIAKSKRFYISMEQNMFSFIKMSFWHFVCSVFYDEGRVSKPLGPPVQVHGCTLRPPNLWHSEMKEPPEQWLGLCSNFAGGWAHAFSKRRQTGHVSTHIFHVTRAQKLNLTVNFTQGLRSIWSAILCFF